MCIRDSIEDHAEALVEHGYTEEDAAARAVELMGDPEETGKACLLYTSPGVLSNGGLST